MPRHATKGSATFVMMPCISRFPTQHRLAEWSVEEARRRDVNIVRPLRSSRTNLTTDSMCCMWSMRSIFPCAQLAHSEDCRQKVHAPSQHVWSFAHALCVAGRAPKALPNSNDAFNIFEFQLGSVFVGHIRAAISIKLL